MTIKDVIARGKLTGKYERFINLLLIRDPFNLFASRFRGRWQISNALRARKLWKMYAREFLGDQNKISNKVCLKFNDWFSDESYRRWVSSQFGQEFTDEGKNSLGHWGSSFDGKIFKTNANEMKVLDRWQSYIDHDDFLTIISDPELLELSRRIFGPPPKEITKRLKRLQVENGSTKKG